MRKLLFQSLERTTKYYTFKTPFRTSWGVLQRRRVELIRGTTSCGVQIESEVAPLEGFSEETFVTVVPSLGEVILRLLRVYEDEVDSIEAINEVLRLTSQEYENMPSLVAGVEWLLIKVLAHRRGCEAYGLFTSSLPHKVTSHYTIGVDTFNDSKRMEKYLQDGHSVFKVKVGPSTWRATLKNICLLRERYPSFQVRLDANGSLSKDESFTFFKEAAQVVEFIEEPLKDAKLDDFRTLHELQGTRLALDESLRRRDLQVICNEGGLSNFCSVVVMKPSMLGGVIRCLSIAQLCHANGRAKVDVMLSTLFEGECGIEMAHCVGKALPEKPIVSGLGTLDMFED
jgi:o-succinylbenzoate synthase